MMMVNLYKDIFTAFFKINIFSYQPTLIFWSVDRKQGYIFGGTSSRFLFLNMAVLCFQGSTSSWSGATANGNKKSAEEGEMVSCTDLFIYLIEVPMSWNYCI